MKEAAFYVEKVQAAQSSALAFRESGKSANIKTVLEGLLDKEDSVLAKHQEFLQKNLDEVASLIFNCCALLTAYQTYDINRLAALQKNIEQLKADDGFQAFIDDLPNIYSAKEFEIFGIIAHGQARLENFIEISREFILAEKIGHDIAYQYKDSSTHEDDSSSEEKKEKAASPDEDDIRLSKQATVCDLESGDIQYDRHHIRITRADDTLDEGLKGEIMVPSSLKKGQTATLYIAWAGTHSSGTVKADFERAPGEESFRRHENQILEAILKECLAVYEKTGMPPKIKITGHSLGASLGQLTFHSLQRVFASIIAKDESMKFEREFREGYERLGLKEHLQDIQKVIDKFDIPDKIAQHGLTLSTWNSAGVLDIIETHSNQLSKLLTEKEIPQKAFWGFNHGDPIPVTQCKILSDIEHNGATVIVAKHCDDVIGYKMKAAGFLGGAPSGALMGSAILPGPGTVIGGLLGGFGTAAAASKISVKAHTQKHFENITTSDDFNLRKFQNRNITYHDSRQQRDRTTIRKELAFQSTVSKIGSSLISARNISGIKREFHDLVMAGDAQGCIDCINSLSRASNFSSYTAYTSMRDGNGNTPLHLIAKKGDIELWNKIADGFQPYKSLRGTYTIKDVFDYTAENNAGQSPIDIAKEKGHSELVEQWLSYAGKEEAGDSHPKMH